MSQGKGISDAVRGAVGSWVTQSLLELLYQKYTAGGGKLNQSQFAMRVRSAESWKRGNRTRDPNGPGWLRNYYSLEFGGRGSTDVNLQVRTNSQADTNISYVTFHVYGKLVSGGACDVPSVFFEKWGIDKSLKAMGAAPMLKTAATAAFVPFTDKQLAALATQLEFGRQATVDRLFEERF